ncbi:GCN5 family acetyltransferase [Arachidicoccus ginsenosidimutans]|nr:GCN5 family acetyltransferase [Arachidicoccus sp. BS20]
MREKIKQIRLFNRFYTAHLGILNHHILESEYSLSEVRVLYEIGERCSITAQELGDLLKLDKGYLSRIVKLFIKNKIIIKSSSKEDRRVHNIKLTATGEKLLKSLQDKSDKQVNNFIGKLSFEESEMLVGSMKTIKSMLSDNYDNKLLAQNVVYRDILMPGDIGYLIYLHGKLYAQESGYSQEFEGYVVKTFYDFLEHYSSDKDKVWLAVYNGQIVGCIAILGKSIKLAQLRWFLVHPVFRGTGIGSKLLDTALSYCKTRKYKSVYLLTTDVQQRAISMYKKAGFVPVESIEVHQWGKVLHEEKYELKLGTA